MKENKILKQEKGDYYSRIQSLNKKNTSGDFFSMKSPINSKDLNFFSSGKFYEIAQSRINFTDIVQDKELKEKINDIIDEYRFQKKIKSFGLKCDNKIIFYGPSGCGKTLTALALASALKKKIYVINLATVVSSSLGKTSSNIFDIVEDAKMNDAIIFFDEFDALSKMRKDDNDHGEMKRITSSLLQIMDFLDDETIFIAATNYIDLIDTAILRRFSKRVSFILPDDKYLRIYVYKLLKATDFKADKGTIILIANELHGLSYAEARDKFYYMLKKYIVKNLKQGKDAINKINKDFIGVK